MVTIEELRSHPGSDSVQTNALLVPGTASITLSSYGCRVLSSDGHVSATTQPSYSVGVELALINDYHVTS